MSLFTESSLCLVPSGVKDGKVYSIKPTDGSGDLTFTRTGDTATRIAPNGLIEKVRTNYLLQSNSFDTTWLATDATITSGATDPNGGTTAWTLANTAASGIIQQAVTLTGLRTVSIYAKQGTHRYLYFGAYVGSGTQSYQVFDLQDGVITDGALGRIQSVGGGWYRCTSFGADGTTGGVQIFPSNNSLGAGTTSGNIQIWKCQYESGDIATDYIATTTAAVSVGPVANVPRLDYLGSSCPRLILEPQRTNVITNNNDFATGAANVTVLSNNATSPEGYQNADLITGDAGTLTKVTNFNGASAGAYTLSVFAKYNTQQWIQLGAGGIASFANFDIQNGVVGTTNATSSIEDYGSGWYRCSLNMVSGTPLSHYVGIITNGTSARLSTTASTGSFWAYGIQSEIGAYPTSVVPTLAASVTRGADLASKTGISSLIGQTEGTLFVEFVVDSSSSPTMAFFVSAAGVFDNAIWIQQNASDSVIFRVFSGTTEQCSITKTGLTNGQTVKIAGAYKANDFVLYVNGVQVGTDNSGTIPSSLSQLEIGSYAEVGSPYNQNRPVSQALLFKTRLSNADLAALTA
jgi:hypothetical protein